MKLFTRKPLVLFLFVVCTLLGIQQAKATHAMGGDISYRCIDSVNHVYIVHVNFYRDCVGITPPDQITLNVESATCGQSFTATLLKLPAPPTTNGGVPYEVSPLCPTSIIESQCANINNQYPGVMGVPYEVTVTLPETCVDWTFSISIGARNDAVTNLVDPGAQNLYIRAVLNNVIALSDDSPDFTTIPTPYFCINNSSFYNHGAVDADGDSLVYTLINPLGASAIPIGYKFPFTPTNPMSTTSGTFGFDIYTGQMTFTANAVQNATIAVLVEEYRNGQLIGSTMRDVQFVALYIDGCSAPSPAFSNVQPASVSGGFFITPTLIEVCPGTTVSFVTGAKVRNTVGSDSVFLESNIAQAIPGANLTITTVSRDSAFATFNWATTIQDTGLHTFILSVRDNHCPLASNQAYAITINVLKGTNAGPDVYYCPSGGALQLRATGGTQFTWSPKLGLNDSTIANPLASPNRTTTYVVTSNLTSTCKNRDTITVFRVADFTYNLTVSKDTICLYDISQLNITGDANFAPYSYTWTPPAGLSSTTIANPYAQPSQTTTYSVTIRSDKTGCARKTTAKVVVEGVGPRVKLTANRNQVCVGDTIQLNSLVSTVACGAGTIPCSGNSVIKTFGTDSIHGFGTPTPYQGSYMAGRFQMLFTVDELQAMGMKPGSIKSLALDVFSRDNIYSYPNFTIRMGCTDQTRLVNFIPGLSQVYFAGSHTPPASGWNTHVFNTPYAWDGLSNLVIEICFTNNAYFDDDRVNASATGFNSVVYAQADNQIGCNLTGNVASIIISGNRPNVRFDYCAAPAPAITHSWTPEAGLITPDSLNPKVVLDGSRTYFLTVNDGSCQGSAGIALKIDTSFNVTVGPDVTLCNGTPLQLSAVLTGELPTVGVTCGANGTACSTTPENKVINLAGTSVSGHTPFIGDSAGNYSGSRTQILYRSTYLANAGIKKGTISSIGLNIAQKKSTLPFAGLNIKMGCSSKVQLDDNLWEPTQLVYTNANYTTTTGWNDFALQNTFDWDGVSNIVVEICWNFTDSTLAQTGADLLAVQSTNYVSFHTGAGKGTPGCDIAAPTLRYYAELPPLRMTICPPPLLPITYKWTPTSVVPDNIANPVVTPTQPTVYRVTTKFGNECAKADELLVTPVTISAFVFQDTAICQGEQVQLLATGGNKYTWTGANLSCNNCPNPVATPDENTTYTVLVTDSISGCTSEATVIITVGQKVELTPPFVTDTADGTPVTIAFTATGGNGTYSYSWTPPAFLDRADTSVAISTPTEDVQYTVKATSGPCSDSSIVTIRLIQVDSVVVPTAFTPNGDNSNNEFYPIFMNQDVSTVKAFRIYNRYGQVVHDGASPWDGRFKGAEQPVGTYVYYLAVQTPGNKEKHYQGSVTLIR